MKSGSFGDDIGGGDVIDNGLVVCVGDLTTSLAGDE
jgi:hypothetical protein